MMSSAHDHQILIDYLLGALPETEAERFDELSIADDEFVSRLTAVENDLVDAYVRGDLSEDARRQFRAHYLSSQKRRDKVAFADALRLHEQRDEALPEKTAAPESRRRFAPWRFLTVAGPAPAWALAAAAVTLAAAYLFITNGRLRQELARSQSARASLEGRTRDLWSQLEHEQSARSAIPDKPQPGAAAIERLVIVSAILAPPTRGTGPATTVPVPRRTDLVALQLRLESDDFPRYRVAVKTADGRVI